MATTELSATFGFSDGTSREIKNSPYDVEDSAVSSFRANVKSFNTSHVADVEDYLISSGGAKTTGITAAKITTTNSTKIYNGAV